MKLMGMEAISRFRARWRRESSSKASPISSALRPLMKSSDSGRRELTLCRLTPDLIYDQLIGAGCARKLVFSWAGNPAALVHCTHLEGQLKTGLPIRWSWKSTRITVWSHG